MSFLMSALLSVLMSALLHIVPMLLLLQPLKQGLVQTLLKARSQAQSSQATAIPGRVLRLFGKARLKRKEFILFCRLLETADLALISR